MCCCRRSVIAVRGPLGTPLILLRSSAVGGDVGQLPILIVDLENRRVILRPEGDECPNRPVHPARLVPLFPKQEKFPEPQRVDLATRADCPKV